MVGCNLLRVPMFACILEIPERPEDAPVGTVLYRFDAQSHTMMLWPTRFTMSESGETTYRGSISDMRIDRVSLWSVVRNNRH
eukprot:3010893-Pleurochrysis_carterae.AAC.3